MRKEDWIKKDKKKKDLEFHTRKNNTKRILIIKFNNKEIPKIKIKKKLFQIKMYRANGLMTEKTINNNK